MGVERFGKPSAGLFEGQGGLLSRQRPAAGRGALEQSEIPRSAPAHPLQELRGRSRRRARALAVGCQYVVCSTCSQLNGTTQDRESFTASLYQESGGEHYKGNYLHAYDQRVESIYLPKMDFLQEVLGAEGESKGSGVLDIGCGGGHFARARALRGVLADGIEPSAQLVALGSERLQKNRIGCCDLGTFEETIKATERGVVSMIGVLEHLREP